MSLYPTPTRLKLLRAIGGDEVIERDGLYFQGYDSHRDLVVTARTLELIKAGWAELATRGWNGVWRCPRGCRNSGENKFWKLPGGALFRPGDLRFVRAPRGGGR